MPAAASSARLVIWPFQVFLPAVTGVPAFSAAKLSSGWTSNSRPGIRVRSSLA